MTDNDQDDYPELSKKYMQELQKYIDEENDEINSGKKAS
jgi:hypothetical protein